MSVCEDVCDTLSSNGYYSVEHGSPDSTSLSITVGARPGGFYVADDGLGIPAAERDRVFRGRPLDSRRGNGRRPRCRRKCRDGTGVDDDHRRPERWGVFAVHERHPIVATEKDGFINSRPIVRTAENARLV